MPAPTFKRHVDNALHDLDDGLAALTELASPDSGTVSVAFQPSLGTWLVPDLVASFHARFPDVGFDLFQVRDDLAGPTLSGGGQFGADLEFTAVRLDHQHGAVAAAARGAAAARCTSPIIRSPGPTRLASRRRRTNPS